MGIEHAPADQVSLQPVGKEGRDELWAMLQQYLAELSVHDAALRPRRGPIPYVFFDLYWSDPEHRFPYFIHVGEQRAGLLLLSEGDRPGYGYDGRCVEVSEIYVAPPFRGRGIGHRAMQFALDAARRMDRPLLWSCYSTNTRALGLYYSFVADCEHTALWRARITYMTDSHGCHRKNFRIEPAG